MPDIYLDVDTALAEVPVNLMPLLDSTDFVTRETAVAYNAAGMDLVWNFVTSAGAFTQTAVTPTTAGDYDWTHQGDGMYTIEIPASGGASINNDTEGYGWFTGVATGVLPWRGPVIGFRAAGLNDKLCDSPYSATRGLAGTALPDAAADAAGGLPVSDAGGLDLDAKIGALTFTVAGDVDVNVQSWGGSAVATPTVAGVPEVDVTHWLGTAVATPTVAGVPEVDATHVAGTAQTAGDINDDMLAYFQLALRTDAGIATDRATELAAINADEGSGAGSFDNTANPSVDVASISGDATAADNAEAFFDGTGYAGTNNVIPTVTTVTTATNVTTVNGLAAGVITAASIATDAIDADALAADAIAEINATVDTALADIGLDHLIQTALPTGPSTDIALASVFGYLMDNGTAWSYDRTTDSLEALAGGGAATDWTSTEKEQIRYRLGIDGTESAPVTNTDLNLGVPTAAAVADAVLLEAVTDHSGTAGSLAAYIAGINTTGAALIFTTRLATGTVTDAAATAGAFDTDLTAADDWYNDALLVFVAGNLVGQAPQPISDYANANGRVTLGESFTAAPDNGSAFYVLTRHVHPITQIAAGVRTELTTELGRIDAAVSTRASQTSLDTVDTNVDSILVDTGTDGVVVASHTAAAKAEVNAEVVDALNTDTYAEPSAAPGATVTLAAKIGYLYQTLRNRVTVTSSAKTVYSDAGVALWSKSLSDDGTTYQEAEGS